MTHSVPFPSFHGETRMELELVLLVSVMLARKKPHIYNSSYEEDQ